MMVILQGGDKIGLNDVLYTVKKDSEAGGEKEGSTEMTVNLKCTINLNFLKNQCRSTYQLRKNISNIYYTFINSERAKNITVLYRRGEC